MNDHAPINADPVTRAWDVRELRAPEGASQHPAMVAWRRLSPGQAGPGAIERLQKKKKGCVYRIRGVGPGGSDVVGKVSTVERIAQERAIYEQVLPLIPVTGVEYYGHVDEPERVGCWIFVRDAGGEPYSPRCDRHRMLGGRWLARLHVSAAELTSRPDRIADRRAGHYLSQLRTARETLASCTGNPALSTQARVLMRDVVRQFDLIESRWAEVRRWADVVPATFVHGDFAPKNMRVRAGDVLAPYDWGSAGWGSVAADLAQAGTGDAWDYWANVDLGAYLDGIREVWRGVTERDVRMAAAVGKIFRCLVCVCLDAPSFGFEYLERAVADLTVYRAAMAQATIELGWGE